MHTNLDGSASGWVLHSPRFESDAINPALAVSPWAGHRRFAYDLMAFLKPQLIVELGSHFGCSFFAFCQAAKDLGLPSRLIAVDTWEGDEHAGYYGAQPYETVIKTIAASFSSLNTSMKRMLFRQALSEISDASVDVLHIDGLHTYEAVQDDFTTWLPKLKPDGVVLFHDVAASTGYGSHQYWLEISAQHPHFQFDHNWGLGILFPKGDAVYQRMLAQHLPLIWPIYELSAENELMTIQLRDHVKMVEDRDAYIQQLEARVDEGNAYVKQLEARVAEGVAAVRHQDKLVSERDEYIQQLEGRVNELSQHAQAH